MYEEFILNSTLFQINLKNNWYEFEFIQKIDST